MKEAFEWHKIANTPEELHFSCEGLASVCIGDRKLCIAFLQNKFFACSALCPHAGGQLAAGFTDSAGNIICSVHCYKFSLTTGRNVSGEGYLLKTFPVETRVGGIYVGIKKEQEKLVP